MDIIFYTNKSESNRLEKDLTEIETLQGAFRDSEDVINPIINVSSKSENLLSNYCNYCFIPSLGRYYFIDKMVSYRANVVTLYLKEDVLQTYKEAIKSLRVVTKSDTGNPYFNGNSGNYDVRLNRTIINLENNFNSTGVFILTAINSNTIT